MAWRYPPQHIGPNYVADTSPINEALTAVVGESTGMLNEHNFDSPSTDTNPESCLLSRLNLVDEAAFRLHYATASTLPDPANYKKVGWVEIDSVDGWQTFSDDGCTLEFTAYGGLAWLNASFNVHCGNDVRTNVQKGYGYNFAIELDGIIVYESLLGSGDSTSEFYNGPNGRAARTTMSKTTQWVTPQCGGGISAARIPVVVDAIVNLPPGRHTVRIAVMNIRGKMVSGNTNGTAQRTTHISNRELFVLELVT